MATLLVLIAKYTNKALNANISFPLSYLSSQVKI